MRMKTRRSHAERLRDANSQAERAAKRLARKLVQVEKYETASKLRDRRQDTRRKIIAGALALEEKDASFRRKLWLLIDEYVTTDRDRELFNLAPITPATVDQPAAEPKAA